jgi:homoaconitase
MATICNMGAEVGATTSIFPYSKSMESYLTATRRHPVAEVINSSPEAMEFLAPDHNAEYDQVVDIDLSSLEPHINGPFTPDLSHPISLFKERVIENNWPEELSVGLIGSCTNSSYEDMSKVADIVEQATKAGLRPKVPFLVTPGSEQIRATIESDGITQTLEQSGATVLGNIH